MRRIQHSIEKGFTLLELMIVTAIVGVLASLAISLYEDYVVQVQVTEAFALSNGLKIRIGEVYNDEGSFVGINSGQDIIPPANETFGNYTSSVVVTQGVIEATLGNKASAVLRGQTITLSPIATIGSMSWQCSFSALQRYAPKNCRN